MMPGCDGIELGERIAESPRFQATRLVLLTSARDANRAPNFGKAGFIAYLLKPASSRELCACLIRAVSLDGGRWQVRTQKIVAAPSASGPNGERRILLAEDNAVNQKVARGILDKLGYAVEAVGNGAEAVAAWESGRYHLILMDCQMPVMDGYQATREIRQREAAGIHVPIVALTADALKGAEEQCRAAGMDDYLTKPLDRARLAEVLARHFDAAPPGAQPGAARVDTSQPSSDPVDWPRLLQVVDHDDALVDELVELFVQSGDAALRDISAALGRGDLPAVGRVAHSLKGSSANIYARAASAAAAELESAARAGQSANLAPLEATLRLETERTISFLRAKRA